MTITSKTVGLPSGYRKVAHITLAKAMGVFVTVAHFQSEVQGQVGVYFMYEHGKHQIKPKEISRDFYLSLLRKYYAVEPTFPVDV